VNVVHDVVLLFSFGSGGHKVHVTHSFLIFYITHFLPTIHLHLLLPSPAERALQQAKGVGLLYYFFHLLFVLETTLMK
jgi:hypothetical protein